MIKLGADEVIPDEFGTSVEIFSRVLHQYHVPDGEINAFTDQIRSDGYELLRNKNASPTKLNDIKLNLSNVEVSSFRLHHSSSLVGKLLSESGLRSIHGMNVLLLKRGETVLPNPSPDVIFKEGDIVVVVGKKMPQLEAQELFGDFEPSLAT
jgi:CPA2 family monovalent cation:H+ antiporter-2